MKRSGRSALLIGTAALLFTVAPACPLGAKETAPSSPAPSPAPLPLDALLGTRALRHARLLLQLRLLELRELRLHCVRNALIRRLPPDLLTGTPADPVKHSDPAAASIQRGC